MFSTLLYEIRVREADNDDKGPRRRQTRRLGPR